MFQRRSKKGIAISTAMIRQFALACILRLVGLAAAKVEKQAMEQHIPGRQPIPGPPKEVHPAGVGHRIVAGPWGLPTPPFPAPDHDMCLPGSPHPPNMNLHEIALEYAYKDIVKATSNFAATNKLGGGSAGAVYRGQLSDGFPVAIKELNGSKEDGFFEELQVLSKFRHPNLVTLMGFACGGDKRFLIYELLSRNLTKWLRLPRRNPPCRQKLSILLDVARGLSHLHCAKFKNQNRKVFHRDIKPDNIMIDENGRAKMADFGLALLSESESVRVESASGTVGYADPFYVRNEVVTERNEVYSFGMVFLEILTGRPPASENWDRKITYLWPQNLTVDYIFALSQARWPRDYEHIELLRAIVKFALSCIHRDENGRPPFVEIVKNIEKWLAEYDRLEEQKAQSWAHNARGLLKGKASVAAGYVYPCRR